MKRSSRRVEAQPLDGSHHNQAGGEPLLASAPLAPLEGGRIRALSTRLPSYGCLKLEICCCRRCSRRLVGAESCSLVALLLLLGLLPLAKLAHTNDSPSPIKLPPLGTITTTSLVDSRRLEGVERALREEGSHYKSGNLEIETIQRPPQIERSNKIEITTAKTTNNFNQKQPHQLHRGATPFSAFALPPSTCSTLLSSFAQAALNDGVSTEQATTTTNETGATKPIPPPRSEAFLSQVLAPEESGKLQSQPNSNVVLELKPASPSLLLLSSSLLLVEPTLPPIPVRVAPLARPSSTSSSSSSSLFPHNPLTEEQNEDLIELLAQFYIHTRLIEEQLILKSLFNNKSQSTSKDASNQQQQQQQDLKKGQNQQEEDEEKMKVEFGADEESLLKWLKERQEHFNSLKNATFELLQEYPNRSIIVCDDGPKILVLPDRRDIVYCYTSQQWIEKLWSDVEKSLTLVHYPIIILNILIFLFGTTGNIFVCLSVYRNHQLRNVTNYFIVNLAFADFLVILICLPATVVWDLSLTWFFGTIPCKLIMFLQDVSISVSVLTLTAISIDRYYAICYPLKFKTNLSQAKKIIVLIWIVSLLIMAPNLVYLRARASEELSEAGLETILYSDCNYDWSLECSRLFQFVKTILLYLLPFLLMFVAHFKILQALKAASASGSSRSALSSGCHLQQQQQHQLHQAALTVNGSQLSSSSSSKLPNCCNGGGSRLQQLNRLTAPSSRHQQLLKRPHHDEQNHQQEEQMMSDEVGEHLSASLPKQMGGFVKRSCLHHESSAAAVGLSSSRIEENPADRLVASLSDLDVGQQKRLKFSGVSSADAGLSASSNQQGQISEESWNQGSANLIQSQTAILVDNRKGSSRLCLSSRLAEFRKRLGRQSIGVGATSSQDKATLRNRKQLEEGNTELLLRLAEDGGVVIENRAGINSLGPSTSNSIPTLATPCCYRDDDAIVRETSLSMKQHNNNQGQQQLIVTMHNKSKLESRRAAAKMLMTIVMLFGICYLPVHLINSLRQFLENIPQTDVTSTISMLAHCICYLNSAINPIIYNHMNSVFRAEFKKFLSCLCWLPKRPTNLQQHQQHQQQHQQQQQQLQQQQQQQQQQIDRLPNRLSPSSAFAGAATTLNSLDSPEANNTTNKSSPRAAAAATSSIAGYSTSDVNNGILGSVGSSSNSKLLSNDSRVESFALNRRYLSSDNYCQNSSAASLVPTSMAPPLHSPALSTTTTTTTTTRRQKPAKRQMFTFETSGPSSSAPTTSLAYSPLPEASSMGPIPTVINSLRPNGDRESANCSLAPDKRQTATTTLTTISSTPDNGSQPA